MDIFVKCLFLMKEGFHAKYSTIVIDIFIECIKSSQTFVDEVYLQLFK